MDPAIKYIGAHRELRNNTRVNYVAKFDFVATRNIGAQKSWNKYVAKKPRL